MLAVILVEIRAVPAEQSRGRHNPRAVKRKMSNFPTRSRAAASDQQRWRYADHIRILPPVGPPPPLPTPSTAEPTSATAPPKAMTPPPAAAPDHRHHVMAWRASGRSRAAYCRQHGLNENTFNHWVARLRPCVRPKCRKAQVGP